MKTLLNIVSQVDQSQHLSEERAVINYIDDADKPQTQIVKISELSDDEKALYEANKAMFVGKIIIPA
jgi:hypothetical protein